MYQSVALCCKKRHSLSHQSLEKKNSRLQMVGWKNGKINTTSHKKNVAGEEGDASEFTVSSWTERVKELTLNYAARQDVWNMDESGAFWKALPERSLTEKRKRCRGGKQAKQWATVAFFVFQLQRPGCSQI